LRGCDHRRANGGQSHFQKIRKVQIGKDLGTRLEIAKGLSATDQIIVNPSHSLNDGMKVHVVEPNQDTGLAARTDGGLPPKVTG
jgi:hypothetical protein